MSDAESPDQDVAAPADPEGAEPAPDETEPVAEQLPAADAAVMDAGAGTEQTEPAPMDTHGPDEHGPDDHEAGGHAEHQEHAEHEEHEHDDEHLTLREALRERLVKLEGMSPGMKLLLGAVIAQLVAAAVFLALRGVSMPSIVGDASSDTDFSDIPDVVFVLAMVGFCAAWALVLSGVYRAGWLLRLLGCAAFGWAFWDVHDVFDGESAWGAAGAGACVILVLVMAVVTYYPERRFREARAKGEATVSKALHRLRLATPLLLFGLVAGACGIAWLSAVQADKIALIGHTDVNSSAVAYTTTFSDLLSNHQYVLIPLLVLAGSEFGDWSDFVLRRVLRLVRRPSKAYVLAGVTVVVAGLMAWDAIHVANGDEGGGLQPEGLLGLAVIGTVALVVLLAKPSEGRWSPKVPFLALAFVAVGDSISDYVAQKFLSDTDPLLNDKLYGIADIVWVIVSVLCIGVLVARRRKLPGPWVNALVFVVLVGATETLQDLGEVGRVVHPLGLNYDNASLLGPEGIIGELAILTVGLVLVAFAVRKVGQWETPITIALVMLLGLEAIYRVDHVFGRVANVTGNFAIAAAVIMVVALSWEFLSSGESITNDDTLRFARSTRLLVFSGYVLLVAVSVLYYSDLRVHGTNNVIESEFDSEEWVRAGILFLGIPMVLTMAIARLQLWRLSRAAGETVEEEVEEVLMPAVEPAT